LLTIHVDYDTKDLLSQFIIVFVYDGNEWEWTLSLHKQ